MERLFKILYKYWMKFTKKIAVVPTAIVLFMVYFGIISLVALINFIARKDILDKRVRDKDSFWLKKERIPTDFERCKRQF